MKPKSGFAPVLSVKRGFNQRLLLSEGGPWVRNVRVIIRNLKRNGDEYLEVAYLEKYAKQKKNVINFKRHIFFQMLSLLFCIFHWP
jgi:hypothetical protein